MPRLRLPPSRLPVLLVVVVVSISLSDSKQLWLGRERNGVEVGENPFIFNSKRKEFGRRITIIVIALFCWLHVPVELYEGRSLNSQPEQEVDASTQSSAYDVMLRSDIEPYWCPAPRTKWGTGIPKELEMRFRRRKRSIRWIRRSQPVPSWFAARLYCRVIIELSRVYFFICKHP